MPKTPRSPQRKRRAVKPAPAIRRQKPVKGGRIPLSPTVLHEIDQAVAQTARRFSCSKSFVIAVALAEFFGIEAESYVKG